MAGGVSALYWRTVLSQRTLCQSNLRRLGTGLLLYAQDHDGRFPPTDYRLPDGTWRPWAAVLHPYYDDPAVLTCPSNRAESATEPYRGYRYPYSYSLNMRFYGVFSRGPYPLENLELPGQTALVVESGRYRTDGPFGKRTYPWAMAGYWDTAWWPGGYPSPHLRRMNVAAADGHVVWLPVAHYRPGAHDALYGRLGRSIYNWNGGHPNGDTAGPPRE
jgi:prepilin-type processing-associated H-X9-DG protein